MKLNLNDTMRVQLTDYGRELLRAEYEPLHPSSGKYAYSPTKEDAEGWSTHTIWSLMSVIGSEFTICGKLPMITTFHVEDDGECDRLKDLLGDLLPDMEARVTGMTQAWPGREILTALHRNESLVSRIKEALK